MEVHGGPSGRERSGEVAAQFVSMHLTHLFIFRGLPSFVLTRASASRAHRRPSSPALAPSSAASAALPALPPVASPVVAAMRSSAMKISATVVVTPTRVREIHPSPRLAAASAPPHLRACCLRAEPDDARTVGRSGKFEDGFGGPIPYGDISPDATPPEAMRSVDASSLTKSIDGDAAGAPTVNPAVQLALVNALKFLFGRFGVPIADAQVSDVQDLLGGALFLPLYKWMRESGPVFLLPTGPLSSFLVVSDPAVIKHVLRFSDHPDPARNVYGKGLVTEVSLFLFGRGFAVAQGDEWRVRRKVFGPGLHRGFLETMVERTFGPAAIELADVLAERLTGGGVSDGKGSGAASPSPPAGAGPGDADAPQDLESLFSQYTLDVIGQSIFNHGEMPPPHHR